jgi:hypothetical protein
VHAVHFAAARCSAAQKNGPLSLKLSRAEHPKETLAFSPRTAACLRVGALSFLD